MNSLPPANEVCEGYVLTPVCHSVGGGVSRPRPRPRGVRGSGRGGVSRPTRRGEVGGLAVGVSRPTPGGGGQAHTQGGQGPHPGGTRPTPGGCQAHTQKGSRPRPGGCIPACTEADTPPSRRLLLRAVRILLECIPVLRMFQN